MQILKHRSNMISDISENFGVEIDIRDFNGELVLAHDHPNHDNTKLKEYLKNVKNESLVAINVKSTEIENDLKNILTELKIKNYFTFDWAVPSLLKAINCRLTCAFRLSEYEKEIFPKCSWVWIDSFHKIWFDEMFLESLRNKNLNIAVVSPELHKRYDDIPKIQQMSSTGLIDAICTDFPEKWLQ